MENEEMSEPIKLYRNGEMIETVSPSVSREWQRQGWSVTPDMMPNVAPDELPALPEVENEEPFPWEATSESEPPRRKAGRPKNTQ